MKVLLQKIETVNLLLIWICIIVSIQIWLIEAFYFKRDLSFNFWLKVLLGILLVIHVVVNFIKLIKRINF